MDFVSRYSSCLCKKHSYPGIWVSLVWQLNKILHHLRHLFIFRIKNLQLNKDKTKFTKSSSYKLINNEDFSIVRFTQEIFDAVSIKEN